MLKNTKDMLKNASENNYAIGAFNFTTIDQLKSIIITADELNSPVILAASTSAVSFMGLEMIIKAAKFYENIVKIDFAIHLDHATSFEQCKEAIDAGFTSVMIDGSKHSIEKNVEISKQVVNYAKQNNVSVEGEIGVISGQEDTVYNRESLFTVPQDAYTFVNKSGVDSLAISIGTSHGAYKFKGEADIDFERLSTIQTKLNTTPLVLHGASTLAKDLLSRFSASGGNIQSASGMPFEMLCNAVSLGITKINIDTDLRIAFTTGIRKSLLNKSEFNIRNYISEGQKEMQSHIVNLIENVLKSKNKNVDQ